MDELTVSGRARGREWNQPIPGVNSWSFVYVFFSNGTPFDAPNRSETCRTSW
jgi:hypothetical protein